MRVILFTRIFLGILFSCFIFFVVFLFTHTDLRATVFSGSGAGTPADPYVITSCLQLQEMSNNLSSSYILGNNIDCADSNGWNAGAGFIPIGDNTTRFSGTFDGQSNTIDKLYINRPELIGGGLFGVTDGGSISNVSFTNITIKSEVNGGDFGAAAGEVYGTNLKNISVTGATIICHSSPCGGVIGSMWNKNIAWNTVFNNTVDNLSVNSSSITNLETSPYSGAGGVIGYVGAYDNPSDDGSITLTNLYAGSGVSVYTKAGNAGGLIGFADSSSGEGNKSTLVLSDSYSDASVKKDTLNLGLLGYPGVGGLIGNVDLEPNPDLDSSASLSIFRTHSTGTVEGLDNVGGLIGYVGGIANVGRDSTITITDSYSTSPVTGQANVGGLIGTINTTNGSGAYTGTFSNLYSTGTVTGTDSVGGLVGLIYGHIDTTLSISNSYTSSSVVGHNKVGGFVGYSHPDGGVVTLDKLYSTGAVTATNSGTDDYVGGFAGYIDTGTTTSNVFTTSKVSGNLTHQGGFVGGYTGMHIVNNFYDSTATTKTLCTGIDLTDPADCTGVNTDGTDNSRFKGNYTVAPLTIWDFISVPIWDAVRTFFPTLHSITADDVVAPPITIPVVMTPFASSITATTAVLNGSITNTGGENATTYGFNYGLTGSYELAPVSESGSFGLETFSENLTNLTCATTYHYQSFAINSAGTGTSTPDATFSTAPCPARGGGGGRPAPILSASSSSTATSSSTTIPVVTETPTPTNTPVSENKPFVFVKNLKQSSIDDDVKALQLFLNTHGFSLAKNGAGSSGNETTFFGSRTIRSLIRYQTANGIAPAHGFFGPITRSFVNKIISGEKTSN